MTGRLSFYNHFTTPLRVACTLYPAAIREITMNRHFVVGLVSITFAGHTAAQNTELVITLSGFSHTGGTITARLVHPTGTILAVISDLGFRMTGQNISNFQYNSAFDSDFFGPASVVTSSTSVDFLGGNIIPPLNNAGGTDDSNPLAIATFNAENINSFELVGQVTGAYAGVPFPNVFNYQNADGSVGDMPYRIENYYNWPTPSSSVLLFLAAAGASRRRR